MAAQSQLATEGRADAWDQLMQRLAYAKGKNGIDTSAAHFGYYWTFCPDTCRLKQTQVPRQSGNHKKNIM